MEGYGELGWKDEGGWGRWTLPWRDEWGTDGGQPSSGRVKKVTPVDIM